MEAFHFYILLFFTILLLILKSDLEIFSLNLSKMLFKLWDIGVD